MGVSPHSGFSQDRIWRRTLHQDPDVTPWMSSDLLGNAIVLAPQSEVRRPRHGPPRGGPLQAGESPGPHSSGNPAGYKSGDPRDPIRFDSLLEQLAERKKPLYFGLQCISKVMSQDQ